MEKIKNMLGLGIYHGCIQDKFEIALIKNLERIAKKAVGDEGVCVDEEIGPLERRKKMLDDEEDKVYERALRLLAEIRLEYKKYLPKRGRRKKALELSSLLKRRMRLALWVGMGNEIPFRNLREVLVKSLLEEKGYSYRRKAGEMGWYRDGHLIGENLFCALEHLEGREAVDRKRLTISF